MPNGSSDVKRQIQQQSSVYLVLHADADAAFEDGSYSFHEAMTQAQRLTKRGSERREAQLLEHYATCGAFDASILFKPRGSAKRSRCCGASSRPWRRRTLSCRKASRPELRHDI